MPLNATPLINNFNAGELSPYVDVRSDINKYFSGCQTLENFVPRVEGGASRMPGTYFVTGAKNDNKKSRLVPFHFSTIQSYQLEFAHEKLRFFMDEGIITAPTSDYSLLLHGDGIQDSTSVADNGYNSFTVTINGNAKIDTENRVFGSGSIYLDGIDSYLTVPDHSAFDFSGGIWTIDFRLMPVLGTTGTVYYQGTANDHIRIETYLAGSSPLYRLGVRFFIVAGGVTVVSLSASDLTSDWGWHHIQIGENGNNYYLFINGVLKDSDVLTARPADYSGSVYIGSTPTISSLIYCHLDELRVLKGTCSNAVTFSPPVLEYAGGATPYEIATPYAEEHLFELDVQTQSADTLYIFHEKYAPRKLTRTGHTSWALSVIDWQGGPFLEEKTDITFTPSSTIGLVTLTASATFFLDAHKDSLLKLKFASAEYDYYASANATQFGLWTGGGCAIGPETGAAVGQDDNYCFKITESSSGGTQTSDHELTVVVDKFYELLVYLKNGTGTWTGGQLQIINNAGSSIIGQRLVASVANWTLYRLIFRATETNNLLRLYTELGTGETALFDVVSVREVNEDSPSYGIVKIASILNSTSALCTVQTALGAGDSSAYYEGAWSGVQGFPACGTFFDSRLVTGGTTNQPQTVWGSVTADFENMTPDAEDDSAAWIYTLVSSKVDKIRWMNGQDYLMVGTAGSIFKLGATSLSEPLTQTNVNAKSQVPIGVSKVSPIPVGEGLIWLDRFSSTIRQLVYSYDVEKFVSPDLTRISKHITRGADEALSGITQMAFQSNPQPILWAVRSDGQLLGMTYESQEQVYGWFRVITDGKFESVSVISRDNREDQVWVVVNRTIGGVSKRYIEFFKPRNFYSDIANSFFVHSGLSLIGSSLVTISGLEHLEGKSVSILADGAALANQTVTSGLVTLSAACSTVHVGLHWDSILKPMKLHAGSQLGTARGKKQKIHRLTVAFHETYGGKYGPTETELYDIPFSTGSDPELHTEDMDAEFPGDWTNAAELVIVQDKPLPMTILGIVPRVSLAED